LQILRAVLNFAVRQSWLIRSPFSLGESLISLAAETRRNRTLTREEEERLLAACTGKRAHLRSLLMAALDTGARKGELLNLRWQHVDFARNLITIEATKIESTRYVAMTSRLREELTALRLQAPNDPDVPVFGLRDNFKKSFTTACKLAGVEGFRFHDARHCFATRLIEAGLSSDQARKLTGHQQAGTFDRYHNLTDEAAQQAAQALDVWRAQFFPLTGNDLVN
jgi:integrase